MVKRVLDISISLLAILILSPIMIIVMLLSIFRLGFPVLFCQQRPGLYGQPFEMIKFRTMLNSQSVDGNLLPDSERLTSYGRFLRSTSIDELPELWNVLKGDMSLVGPRPLLMEYLPLYSSEQIRRQNARPGITGWAQVNGRNAISWEEKFALDIWYVDNQSLLIDLKILWLTFYKVVTRQGINEVGSSTMSKFTGHGDN